LGWSRAAAARRKPSAFASFATRKLTWSSQLPGTSLRAATQDQQAQSAEPAASVEAQIRELEERAMRLCASFHRTANVADSIERPWLMGTIKKAQQMINRLELEIR
jgi:hypothetical protein